MKETLKALREQFNYSQNSVAKFLGISRQMYIKYENGDADPGADFNIEDTYSSTVVSMFTKLAVIKQLEVFSELAGIIQKSSKEEASTKLETKKEKSPLERIWERQKNDPGHSDGWKWNREELYDR